jgi:hypothetical protein
MKFYTSRYAFFVLLVIWIALRIYPLTQSDYSSGWEMLNAKKLLEYGFLERGGATLISPMMTGHLAYPQDGTLVDHPYPTIWLFLPVYIIGGTTACVTLLLMARALALWCTYRLLVRYFSPHAAGWGTLFYVLAPVMISMDSDPNAVATAGIMWPFAAAMALKASERPSLSWLLGLTVFFAAQLGWMAHLMAPSLLALAWPADNPRFRDLSRWIFAPPILAIFVGEAIAVAGFVSQILFYSPNLLENWNYIRMQMGRTGEVARPQMLVATAARLVLFAGPGLILSAMGGVWIILRSRAMNKLTTGSLVFIPGFALFAIVLTRFCFVERSPYYFSVFPASILAAVAFERAFPLVLKGGLIGLNAIGIAQCYLSHSLPVNSATAKALVTPIVRQSHKEDIILTNSQALQPPFQPWDTAGLYAWTVRADRILMSKVRSLDDLAKAEATMGRNFQHAVFVLVDQAPPITDDFRNYLKTHGERLGTEVVPIRPEPPSIAMKMREVIWRFSKRFADRGSTSANDPFEVRLEFYRLK